MIAYRSARVVAVRPIVPNRRRPAITAVRCSTNSFGTRKRSRSNAVSVVAASTTAIAPICITRRASCFMSLTTHLSVSMTGTLRIGYSLIVERR